MALNRAIAVANVDGPGAGIEAVRGIQKQGKLETYHLLHAVLGEFELKLGRNAIAAAHFQRALQLTETTAEKVFLEKRVKACSLTH